MTKSKFILLAGVALLAFASPAGAVMMESPDVIIYEDGGGLSESFGSLGGELPIAEAPLPLLPGGTIEGPVYDSPAVIDPAGAPVKDAKVVPTPGVGGVITPPIAEIDPIVEDGGVVLKEDPVYTYDPSAGGAPIDPYNPAITIGGKDLGGADTIALFPEDNDPSYVYETDDSENAVLLRQIIAAQHGEAKRLAEVIRTQASAR